MKPICDTTQKVEKLGTLITFLNEEHMGDEHNSKMSVGCTEGHVFLREWRCNVCECIMDIQDSPAPFVHSFSTLYNEHNTKDMVLGNYNHPICGKSIQSKENPPTQRFCKRVS